MDKKFFFEKKGKLLYFRCRQTKSVKTSREKYVFEYKNRRFHLNPTISSIFDLSPSERLQLVEDLWDDLAATPEAVPVHDWQKMELAKRKANLVKNPASALVWEEVKKRIRSRYDR
jgi:putative addiction module component (TIGR02574 family)